MAYQSWIDKANENLTVAEWRHTQGHVNACANRVYYGMFHAAIAALIKNQIQPSSAKFSHEWVQSNFAGQLIHRRKILAAKFRRYLLEKLTGFVFRPITIRSRPALATLAENLRRQKSFSP